MDVGTWTRCTTGLKRIAPIAQPIVAVLVEKTPVLGDLVTLYGVGESISDLMFLEKVRGFIDGVETIGGPEAREFGEEIRDEPELAGRAAKAVLLSINAISDLEKAPVVGYIYAAFLHGNIDLDTLRRLLNAVDKAMVDDLWTLTAEEPANGKWEDDPYFERSAAIEALRTTGLTALSKEPFQLVGKRSFAPAEVTSLGRALITILREAQARRASNEMRMGV